MVGNSQGALDGFLGTCVVAFLDTQEPASASEKAACCSGIGGTSARARGTNRAIPVRFPKKPTVGKG